MNKRNVLTLTLSLIILLAGSMVQAADYTEEDAKNLAIDGVKLIEKMGLAKAHDVFHDPNGGFKKGELYVFVLDMQGTWLIYPPKPKGEGNSIANVKDADGKYVVMEMIKIAKEKGEGWVNYRWMHPQTNKVTPKVSYVKRVGDTDMFAGVGIYK